MYNLHAVLLDVETAFLYRKLKEEIYMEIPMGYKEVYTNLGNDKVLALKCQCMDWYKQRGNGSNVLVMC